MRVDHRERALPDRAGRAEDGDALHSVSAAYLQHDVIHRRGEQQRVDPIEDAAVARESAPSCPSRRRCASASTRTGRRRCRARRSSTPSSDAQRRPASPAATTRRAPRRAARPNTKPADRALDRLLRADRRRQRPPAERAAGVVLRGVADDHRQHQQEQRRRGPRSLANRDHRADRQPDVERRKQRRRRRARARRCRRATTPSDAAPIATSAAISTDVERQPATPPSAAANDAQVSARRRDRHADDRSPLARASAT